jgi:hypothetical protein
MLALNDLLRQGKPRRDIAGIGFIFWTRHKDDYFNLWTELDPPQPGDGRGRPGA